MKRKGKGKKERRKRKKEKQIFSLIEKNHKNIWKWKLRSNGGVVGNFKRKEKNFFKKGKKKIFF